MQKDKYAKGSNIVIRGNENLISTTLILNITKEEKKTSGKTTYVKNFTILKFSDLTSFILLNNSKIPNTPKNSINQPYNCVKILYLGYKLYIYGK